MSGICGVLNLDGAPIVAHELERLTAFLDFRGPDARHEWVGGEVGLGHTLLRTSRLEAEHQPLSLDGEVWITADARIDGQAELRRKLKASCREVPATAHDAALILHAYSVWGEECTGHLIGDFAFAIWDGRRKRLFCARDHFGVKPFFYALVNGCFVFSNTLNCVRAHPRVGSTLNELAIADFLLFERNQDPTTTIYGEVRRLAPAECLTVDATGVKARRYWTLPFEARVQYRAAGEYVERFEELLGLAVADRVRTDRVSFTMSGGMDSAGVAATASARLSSNTSPLALHANTTVYDWLMPDEERFYAGLVAEKLGISISYRAIDDYKLYERYDDLGAYLPEPFHDPLAVVALDLTKDAASHGRVVLTGYDGDALFSESPRPYFRHLIREGRLGRFMTSAIRFAMSERKILPAGALKSLNPLAARSKPWREPYPPWLNPDFEHRLRLGERFAGYTDRAPVTHPIRPFAFKTFDYLMRHSTFFDRSDPGCTGYHVEYRHPLLDLRLLEHCLSLPPYPWCMRKEILRHSMRGVLPERVLTRPKTPASACPYHERLKNEESRWVDRFAASRATSAFVDRDKIPSTHGEADPYAAWVNLRPLSLDLWLRKNSHSLVS